MRRTIGQRITLVATAVGIALAAGCDTGDGTTLQPPTETIPPAPLATVPLPAEAGGESVLPADPGSGFEVFAPWQDGGPIDPLYTCDGADLSPALSWTAPPAGTVELGVVLVDESLPDDDGRPFVHWAVGGIAPDAGALIEGEVPANAVQSVNFGGTTGYRGPCPPEGQPAHEYRITVFALNQAVGAADGLPAAQLADRFGELAIAAADLFGVYQR